MSWFPSGVGSIKATEKYAKEFPHEFQVFQHNTVASVPLKKGQTVVFTVQADAAVPLPKKEDKSEEKEENADAGDKGGVVKTENGESAPQSVKIENDAPQAKPESTITVKKEYPAYNVAVFRRAKDEDDEDGSDTEHPVSTSTSSDKKEKKKKKKKGDKKKKEDLSDDAMDLVRFHTLWLRFRFL